MFCFNPFLIISYFPLTLDPFISHYNLFCFHVIYLNIYDIFIYLSLYSTYERKWVICPLKSGSLHLAQSSPVPTFFFANDNNLIILYSQIKLHCVYIINISACLCNFFFLRLFVSFGGYACV